MQTHLTGAITGSRLGSNSVQQSAILTWNGNLSGVPVKLFTIKASATQPVAYRLTAVVFETFANGANASTLSVGTSSGGGQLLNVVDLKAGAGNQVNYTPAVPLRIAIADTEIWAVRTDTTTAATVGQVAVVCDLDEVNNQAPTAQGS